MLVHGRGASLLSYPLLFFTYIIVCISAFFSRSSSAVAEKNIKRHNKKIDLDIKLKDNFPLYIDININNTIKLDYDYE